MFDSPNDINREQLNFLQNSMNTKFSVPSMCSGVFKSFSLAFTSPSDTFCTFENRKKIEKVFATLRSLRLLATERMACSWKSPKRHHVSRDWRFCRGTSRPQSAFPTNHRLSSRWREKLSSSFQRSRRQTLSFESRKFCRCQSTWQKECSADLQRNNLIFFSI